MWTFIGKSESDTSNSMIKSIQARMVLELYKGNPDVAGRIMKHYQGFLGVKSPDRDITLFKTFDEYFAWRFVDAGVWYVVSFYKTFWQNIYHFKGSIKR